ncbi:MAG: transposase [Candidatus Nealsonbacteria bacterium]
MPRNKREFINGEIYHVVLRIVDDNLLFKNKDDYYRGIFSIYEFNNDKLIEIRERRVERKREKLLQTISPQSDKIIDKRDKFVDILAFCFMPNHIHLLLKQMKDNGITKFMSKVGTGYASYFNKKYERKGHVFQDKFKSVLIEDNNQLKITFTYIHTNPISIIEPKWKEIGIKDPERVIKFLEQEYKWSSYPDYLENKNFPSVTEREFMTEIMEGKQGFRDFIENWVMFKKELNESELNKSKDLFLG